MVQRHAGRPTVFTPERCERFCKAIGHGHTLRAAARAAGIGLSTVERWLREGRRDPTSRYCEFVDAVDDARVGLEAELDDVEYRLATDVSVPPGTRLRAIKAIRARVFHQGRRDIHFIRSSDRSVADTPERTAGAISDDQLRTAPTHLLERLLQVFVELAEYREQRADSPVGTVASASTEIQSPP